MQTLSWITFLLLFSALAFAQGGAQRTPPGGDTVGSDRPVTRNDIRTEPNPSPDQNQRMTQSSGTSSGYENTPAYAGSSTSQAQQPHQTATGSRRRAHNRSAHSRKSPKRKAKNKPVNPE
ncbi:MAG: hypothetical protein ACR2IF_12335 [Terriglobales bacterium]